jgi:hypothetical protein
MFANRHAAKAGRQSGTIDDDSQAQAARFLSMLPVATAVRGPLLSAVKKVRWQPVFPATEEAIGRE